MSSVLFGATSSRTERRRTSFSRPVGQMYHCICTSYVQRAPEAGCSRCVRMRYCTQCFAHMSGQVSPTAGDECASKPSTHVKTKEKYALNVSFFSQSSYSPLMFFIPLAAILFFGGCVSSVWAEIFFIISLKRFQHENGHL